jgi:hypothetical protein
MNFRISYWLMKVKKNLNKKEIFDQELLLFRKKIKYLVRDDYYLQFRSNSKVQARFMPLTANP